jgi:hypothetical protein
VEKYKDQHAEMDLSVFGPDRRVEVKRKLR